MLTHTHYWLATCALTPWELDMCMCQTTHILSVSKRNNQHSTGIPAKFKSVPVVHLERPCFDQICVSVVHLKSVTFSWKQLELNVLKSIDATCTSFENTISQFPVPSCICSASMFHSDREFLFLSFSILEGLRTVKICPLQLYLFHLSKQMHYPLSVTPFQHSLWLQVPASRLILTRFFKWKSFELGALGIKRAERTMELSINQEFWLSIFG